MPLELLSGLVEPLDTDGRIEILRRHANLVFDHFNSDDIYWFQQFSPPHASWVRTVTKQSREGINARIVRLALGWEQMVRSNYTGRPHLRRLIMFHVSAADTFPGQWYVRAHSSFTTLSPRSRAVTRLSDAPAVVEEMACLLRWEAEQVTEGTVGVPWYEVNHQ